MAQSGAEYNEAGLEIVRIPLSKPIQAHGETVATLVLTEPTGADFARFGEISQDGAFMHRMIVQLAAIPSSSVDQLRGRDFLACTNVIGGFLGDALPAKP